jgi:choline/ethanolamine kinase
VPEFEPFKEDDFYVKPLRGGLTNLLWTVGLKTDVLQNAADNEGKGKRNDKAAKQIPDTIALIREYGRGTESFMNRAQEERVVENLSERGLCPRVYGTFTWGRVEKFLVDSRTLSTPEYASYEYLHMVAELLGKFHAVSSSLLPLCTTEGEHSLLRERLLQWYDIASKTKFEGDDAESKRKQRKLVELDLPGALVKEIAWLLDEIATVKSPVVFCHCDLQDGNVLLHDNKMSMIDFEYSDRLERGFDLGNCFCEMSLDYKVSGYPGFVVNPDMFPDEEKQIKFLEAYAKGAGMEFSPQVRQQLLREANVFVMCSHLHWSIWSVIQAQTSTIEFGYLEYAEQRMDQYYNCKKKWKPQC